MIDLRSRVCVYIIYCIILLYIVYIYIIQKWEDLINSWGTKTATSTFWVSPYVSWARGFFSNVALGGIVIQVRDIIEWTRCAMVNRQIFHIWMNLMILMYFDHKLTAVFFVYVCACMWLLYIGKNPKMTLDFFP